MRAIKFRAKAINGEWHYGDLENSPIGKFCRIHEYWDNGLYKSQYDVGPATVGQFTGLHDKHGNEVYEGDILLYNGNRRTVEWKYGTFGLSMHKNGFPFQAFYELPVPIVNSIVIGNVFDNPEMLEKGGEQ